MARDKTRNEIDRHTAFWYSSSTRIDTKELTYKELEKALDKTIDKSRCRHDLPYLIAGCTDGVEWLYCYESYFTSPPTNVIVAARIIDIIKIYAEMIERD